MSADQQLPFAPAALTLDGFFLLRATVQPTNASDERSWSLDLVHHADEAGTLRRYYVFANLQAVHEGWLVGSTVGGRIHLPKSVTLEELPVPAFEAECRRLFEETLWDAAATYARQLCAMGRVEGLLIPASSPGERWAASLDHERKPSQSA